MCKAMMGIRQGRGTNVKVGSNMHIANPKALIDKKPRPLLINRCIEGESAYKQTDGQTYRWRAMEYPPSTISCSGGQIRNATTST